MNTNFFDSIDVDLNHFHDLYPDSVQNMNNNQYYTDEKFNDTFANSSSHDLNILHLNIRSIRANGSDLITYLSMLNRKFDCICLSETFVTDLDLTSDFLDDYEGFHSIRESNRSGGGVAIYIRNKFV